MNDEQNDISVENMMDFLDSVIAANKASRVTAENYFENYDHDYEREFEHNQQQSSLIVEKLREYAAIAWDIPTDAEIYNSDASDASVDGFIMIDQHSDLLCIREHDGTLVLDVVAEYRDTLTYDLGIWVAEDITHELLAQAFVMAEEEGAVFVG